MSLDWLEIGLPGVYLERADAHGYVWCDIDKHGGSMGGISGEGGLVCTRTCIE